MKLRHQLADAAYKYDWDTVLSILEENDRPSSLVNTTRLGGLAAYTPLHQAALGNAPPHVIERLIRFGAWRTLKTGDDKTAMDIALENGNDSIVPLLKPVYPRDEIPPAKTLEAIETRLHGIMKDIAGQALNHSGFRLPQVSVLLEMKDPSVWCSIPGMYGGFKIYFDPENSAKLHSISWSRVVGGSGRHYEITEDDCHLVEKGFV